MASRTDIYISGHYAVSINAMPFHICTFNSKKLRGRIESYFILVLFLKLNDHQTRCFDYGLRRIHPTDCKFELNWNKFKSKTKSF